MGRYLSIIIILCSFFLIGMIRTANSNEEFDRKEALQMYVIEDTYKAIKNSKEARNNNIKKNDRTIASDGNNQQEFESLMQNDKEEWFDDVDKLK